MILNSKMRARFSKIDCSVRLDPVLQRIADSGFVADGGRIFLAALLPAETNVSTDSFPDDTGYECFINSLHVEDFTCDAPLPQAIRFVSEVFLAWRRRGDRRSLSAVVSSVDEQSAVVKFHVVRAHEKWLGGDPDDYLEAILATDSSEFP